VRDEIENLPTPTERFRGRNGPLSVLVVGGSLGAKVLNEIVPAALSRLDPAQRPHVVHQSGIVHADAVRATYATLRVGAEVLPFIDDMPARLAACDVIVCRAGAVTVSELCAAGVASVLVPLIASTTSHQRDNAAWMAQRGAALHLPQAQLSPESLATLLSGLERDKLRAMAHQARLLARPQAAARVADAIEKLVAAA
jgi:UDP-N-acetylglucosamine--N-acetylmuramyl-(pentapeptide) pyrophosphoryl-undecaprenol N-acetylglucosamine transferase